MNQQLVKPACLKQVCHVLAIVNFAYGEKLAVLGRITRKRC